MHHHHGRGLTLVEAGGTAFCAPIRASLNSNGFTGSIPPSLGNLDKLYWLDLADNRLTGTIPVSTETTPGLDLLVHTKHFNKLTGSIPSTLGLVKSLEVVRLDNNSLTGPVPTNINNLTTVNEMFLSNNGLSGNNLLNGTLDIGTSPVNKLAMIDLRKNQISGFTYRAGVEKTCRQPSLSGNRSDRKLLYCFPN
uniref:Leucine-rich repeat-containing N-terminal plant-type domain-containing protein n=1 Tax=Salix viminalis TaxID=40686 RepID=A0A6N2KJQ5_SALVM